MPRKQSKALDKKRSEQSRADEQAEMLDFVRKIVCGPHKTTDVRTIEDRVQRYLAQPEDIALEGIPILFLAAEHAHLPILRWVLGAGVDIQAKNSEGYNILQIAVANNHRSVVKWLMHVHDVPEFAFQRQMFTGRLGGATNLGRLCWATNHGNDGQTALSLAARQMDDLMVWEIVRDAQDLLIHQSFVSQINALIDADTPASIQAILRSVLREHEITMEWRRYIGAKKKFYDCPQCHAISGACPCIKPKTPQEMEPRVQSYRWWPLSEEDELWNPTERAILCDAACAAAARGHLEILRWLLDDWKVDFNWISGGGMSAADSAASGDWPSGGSKEAKLAKQKEREALEKTHFTPEERVFDRAVAERWDGKSCDELARVLEEEMGPDVPGAIKKQDSESLKARQQLALLKDVRHQERVGVLHFLLDRFGAQAMPQLDVALAGSGGSALLEYLIDTGHLDLASPIALGNSAEQTPRRASPEEDAADGTDEDKDCPVCFGELFSPVSFPCRHSFCRACVQQIKASAASASAVPCPLCRGTIPEQFFVDTIEHLVSKLPEIAPVLDTTLRASGGGAPTTVQDLMLGICGELGLLVPLVWLATVRGADLRARIGGGTVLHLAALRGHLHIVKWCGENGYLDLCTTLSTDDPAVTARLRTMAARQAYKGVLPGALPVHEAVRMKHVAVFEYLEAKGALGKDSDGREWSEYAGGQKGLGVSVAYELARQMLAESLPAKVRAGAPDGALRSLVAGPTAVFLVRSAFLRREACRNALRSLLQLLVERGRVLFLRWLMVFMHGDVYDCLACRDPELRVFSPWQARATLRQKSPEERAGIDMAGMERLCAELETAHATYRACDARRAEFERLFAEGADPVTVLEPLITQQREFMSQFVGRSADYVRWFKNMDLDVRRSKFEMLHPDTQVPASPLEVAMDRGLRETAAWLLQAPKAYSDEFLVRSISTLVGRQGRSEMMQVCVEALEQRLAASDIPDHSHFKNLVVHTLFYALIPEEDTRNRLCSPTDPNFKTRERALAHLEWLLARPFAQAEDMHMLFAVLTDPMEAHFILGGGPLNTLFWNERELLFVGAIRILAASKFKVYFHATAEETLRLTELAVKHGAVKMVRVLALEVGVNVQNFRVEAMATLTTRIEMYGTLYDEKARELEEIKAEQAARFAAVESVLRGILPDVRSLKGAKVAALKDVFGRTIMQAAKERGCEAEARKIMRLLLAQAMSQRSAADAEHVSASE